MSEMFKLAKTKKWLEENIEFVDRHIVEETPTTEELARMDKTKHSEVKNGSIQEWFEI